MNCKKLIIAKLEAWRVEVPLLDEWAASPEYGDHRRSPDRLILRLEDSEGYEGYGEGRVYATGGHPANSGDRFASEGLQDVLRKFLATPVDAIRSSCLDLHPSPTYWQLPLPPSPYTPELGNLFSRIRHPLQTAVESAWLDLIARRAGVPMSQLFGGPWRDRVATDYWMGRVTPEHARRCAVRGKSLGFAGIKLKTILEDPNAARLEAIRDAAGPDFHVTVDPNERFYRLDDALPTITAMDSVGNMRILEDPFPRFRLEEFAALRPRIRARVVLHVDPPESLHNVIAARAAGGLNMDSHTQGMFAWRAAAAAAEAANLPVWHGSGLDLGLSTAAQLHLCAATPNCQLPGDQSGPWLREATLVKEKFTVENGHVLVPPGPGNGVTFDPNAAERYTLEHFTLEA